MSATVSVSRLSADQRPTTIGLITALGLAALVILLAVAFERTIVRVRPFVIAAVQSNFELAKAYATSAMQGGQKGGVARSTTDVTQATRMVFTETIAPVKQVGTVDGKGTDGQIVITSHGTDVVAPMERPIEQPQEIIDEEFTPVEREPSYEVGELYRLIRYPEQARRLGLEGTVVVKALVTAAGTAEQCSVVESDNMFFNADALYGIQRLRFTPARQNDHAVACWIYIPVKFTLR
jgi:TonB family protein